jgi:hypothetical protein
VVTTYLARTVLDQLEHAQAEVDRHVAAGIDGRCLSCGEEQPCTGLLTANQTFASYERLPTRRPGLASRGIHGRSGFGWFAGTKGAADSA